MHLSASFTELPAHVDFLCREIYNWFNCSSLRRLEYKKLWDILNTDGTVYHTFVRLSKTIWLAHFKIINTILKYWQDLKLHFSVVVNKEKCYSARILKDMLSDD